MGRSSYKVYDDRYPYFITFSVQSRIRILKGSKADLIIDSLEYLEARSEARIYCYVIMPDHVHIILQAKNLTKVIQRLKSYTVRRIIDHLKKTQQNNILAKLKSKKLRGNSTSTYQLWQVGYHPVQIESDEMLEQKANYIYFNPVVSGLVSTPEEWKYSSFKRDSSQNRAL